MKEFKDGDNLEENSRTLWEDTVPDEAKPWSARNALNASLCFTCFSVLIIIPVSYVPALLYQYLALCRWVYSEKVGIWLLEHLIEVGSESHRPRVVLGCLSQEYKA